MTARSRRAATARSLLATAAAALVLQPTGAYADEQLHDPGATRILITGDSITQGAPFQSSGGYSWRYFLWKRFESAGSATTIDLVGNKTGPTRVMTPAGQSPTHYGDPDFDYEHAAVSSAEICKPTALDGQVRIDELVRRYQPAVIVSGWGINDLSRGTPAVEVLRCYDTWLRQARSQNPDIELVIARLPWAKSPNSLRFNELLPDWAAARTTARSRIVLAQAAEAYTLADTVDGLHPNAAGERKIAAMMAPSLRALGLRVQADRTILPGNIFRPVAPARPALRVVRDGRALVARWSDQRRTTIYTVRCGGVDRRYADPRSTARFLEGRAVTCRVRATNHSGSSAWSNAVPVGRARH